MPFAKSVATAKRTASKPLGREDCRTETVTDMFIGRNTFGILAGMNLQQITFDYIVVDTVRVPRTPYAVAPQRY